jgi:histidinol dehydrogenase
VDQGTLVPADRDGRSGRSAAPSGLPMIRRLAYDADMIPLLNVAKDADRRRLFELLGRLRLDVRSLLADGALAGKAEGVRKTILDVCARGDAALVDSVRQFDDPDFDASRLKVSDAEMRQAADSVDEPLRRAMRRSIEQVRAYQQAIMPAEVGYEARPGVRLGLRHTPVRSAGLYVPGGKASYPSSLIMLAVPAQVAGVERLAVVTPAGKFGDNALLFAAAHELGISELYRVGGAAGVAALAVGTPSIGAVDKIVGPGNTYVQLAKRLVGGAVGVDGFLGPSEILTIADDSCRPDFIAADLLAQAEHDPGRCFLLTTDASVADAVVTEMGRQLTMLKRREAICAALADDSAIIVCPDEPSAVAISDQIAAEHVNLQLRDPDRWLGRLRHGGAFFVGTHAPVAAGDYLAGPSHCLPTNTTARFSGGVSVYEFLKRSGIAQYDPRGIADDAPAAIAMANCEGLDAHAASLRIRVDKP